ncbi:hypothetical protein JAAARDRAFT_64568 [Jaapia argillacea MUCL 33604]|uniref:Uncharacterized protein n=1 Tax=Jaapia argillacea MUCL 33604 TaxID=933084 RepID=A0A067QCD6_9AGAM|nr:hypothetical protein JAAARDRAFT_64568 [Jaapia argillacea MUCL 33604]
MTMDRDDDDEDWSTSITSHPIFSLPDTITAASSSKDLSLLELSTNTLPKYTHDDPEEDSLTPSGRRQVMAVRDVDLVVAVGKELRMSSLNEGRGSSGKGPSKKTYKVLHTPNIQFEIHQLALSPSGKLLAVAGAFQVAVVVLPRTGFSRLVTATIDCKSIQIGQFYHASDTAPPIAKIEWHPWGEAGSTLLVMTVDGKLREYDISIDTEEPQQVLSFVPEKKKARSFVDEDESEREVGSFTLGQGTADWGPLTVYTLMKSGDVYAMCPYMPQNASIPSSYVHALECFVAAKQEFLSQSNPDSDTSFSTIYSYQTKYVSALLKQLPAGTAFPSPSRLVSVHPPTTIKNKVRRQGPFLLQPAPRVLEGSEGGDATDIVYLSFGSGDEEGEEEERDGKLGVVLIAYKDGKVDVCLDVEKVEGRWESKQNPDSDLPMLAVFETIDLGLVSTLSKVSPPLLDLLQGNHPVFHPDPLREDVVFVYHAFGVHALHLGPLLERLGEALRGEDDAALTEAVNQSGGTDVKPLLTTFSIERRCSNPVIAVSVPNDIYLTYSILILTSAMRTISLPLKLRAESPPPPPIPPPEKEALSTPQTSAGLTLLPPVDGPPAYVSLLGTQPFTEPPILSRPSGLPSNPRLSLPSSPSGQLMITPDTLRYLGTTVQRFHSQIREIQLAHSSAQSRSTLQLQEFERQKQKFSEIRGMIEELKGPRHVKASERSEKLKENQKALGGRLDRVLQGLMGKASPELSEYEVKWFEELGRMKTEVLGAGRWDEGSLATRAKVLQREYNRLLPALDDMRKKEEARRQKLSENQQGLGFSQAFELGERSNEERARIQDIQSEVLRLASKLDVTLGRPPPLQNQSSEDS